MTRDPRKLVRYYDASFRDMLETRTPFHTRKAQGFNEHHSDIAGIYTAQAAFLPCPQCNGVHQEKLYDGITGGYSLYVVYSYKTSMYEKCDMCDYEKIDMSFYSKTTRELQTEMARAIPACKAALENQYVIEDAAIKTWKRDQRKGLTSTHRFQGYNGFGQAVYARNANLFEMLEYYHDKYLPGHSIHNA